VIRNVHALGSAGWSSWRPDSCETRWPNTDATGRGAVRNRAFSGPHPRNSPSLYAEEFANANSDLQSTNPGSSPQSAKFRGVPAHRGDAGHFAGGIPLAACVCLFDHG